MRAKIPPGKKHKARGVSLPPTMSKEAMKRAGSLEMSFSRYVQRLIEADLQQRILAPLTFQSKGEVAS